MHTAHHITYVSPWLIGGVLFALFLVLSVLRIAPRGAHVVDGDTMDGYRCRWRLGGYDAPEYNQPGGAEAHKRLAAILAEGRAFGYRSATDVYGRSVVHLFTWRGPLAWRMVWSGDGHAMTVLTHIIQIWPVLRRKGLWGAKVRPVHPSLWRATHQRPGAAPARMPAPRTFRMPRLGNNLRYERQGLRILGFHI